MTERKVIVAGWYTVQPDKRQAVLESFEDLVQRARTAPGSLDFSISADPLDPSRINMFEFWHSEKALNVWRKVSKPPKRIAKMLQANVRKHVVQRSGLPF